MTARWRSVRAAAMAALAAAAVPSSAWGWGATGHRIVGRLAEQHLSAEAQAAVAALIGPETLAWVSLWPDEMRSDPSWEKGEQWRWHFLSIDDHETLATTARDPKGDALEALERFGRTLRDPAASREDRAAALKWIVHLAGDLHQPLHVGRRADRGGNEILVTWQGEVSNLHAVWDSELLDATRLSFSEYAEHLQRTMPAAAAEWRRASAAEWINESFAVRPAVYEIGDRKLGYGYSFRVLPIIERRLQQAGVRLAALLDQLLSP